MKSPLRAHAVLVVMVIIWGVNFSIAKYALAHIHPLAFNAIRFPLASLFLLGVLAARGQVRLPHGNDWPRVLLFGLLGNLLYQLCFIFGLDHTRAGTASLLLAGTPIVTSLLSSAVGHETIPTRTWVGVACTFAGIVLIVTGSAYSDSGGNTLKGDLLMLGATIMWSCYTVGSRPLIQKHGPVLVTAWTLWAGTIGIVLVGLTTLLRTDLGALQPGTWGAIAFSGLLSIGLSYLFWYYGVSRLGNARTSSYSNITPVVALAFAWLWLGERPVLVQLIGAAIVIAGVTYAQSRPAEVSVEL